MRASGVAVVGDAHNVAIVPRAQVEIVGEVEDVADSGICAG